ncbi:MAG: hypothetical protein HC844_05180 [Tabrizicola sp.]|nr:hypothetical protein [Tabrizicola sp.]
MADPVFYLRAVIIMAGVGLLLLPFGTDALNAALKPVRGPSGACRILAVVDGDTVKLWCAGRGVENARLLGYDSPEKFSPNCIAELVAAERAGWALRGMILAATDLAVTRRGMDRYDRPLILLRLDGADVAEAMIREGHGRAYEGGKRGGWCGV